MALSRDSLAERAAQILRRCVVEGRLPGTQLREERLVTSMGISRNTLREAFRLLAHDGLLVPRLTFHEPCLNQNRAILQMLEAGLLDRAADELERYLRDSEEHLMGAYRTNRHQTQRAVPAGEKLGGGVRT